MANSFGQVFRITTWGESHGPAVGVVIDGCPAGLTLDMVALQTQMGRRRPGQSRIVTQRQEPDEIQVLSGLFEGKTTGTPLAMMVTNSDQRSRDYDEMQDKFRPSHADFTYFAKYGIRDWRGGGRASARETLGRVAAGSVAEQILKQAFGVEIVAWVSRVQAIESSACAESVSRESVDQSPVRCGDPVSAERMIELIESIRKSGDSVGGTVNCVARGVPPGWGDPVFDKLEADLAKAMLSLPACKGFESGSGFSGTYQTGRAHNDEMFSEDQQKVQTFSNNSGGIQGGISNGMPILLRAAFKPTATVMSEQRTVNERYENVTVEGKGRHDPCVLPRAVPLVEAMTALVLLDHALRQRAIHSLL